MKNVDENDIGCCRSIPYIFYALIGLSTLPWLWLQFNQVLNGNITYLTFAAGHMISGEAMSEAYYDTNPPLSVILYAIPAMMIKYMGMSLYHAVFVYSCACLMGAVTLLHQALRLLPTITDTEKHVILGSFICVSTIAAHLYFAEREYFISLSLLPFILAQIAITKNIKNTSLALHLILAMGALFIMIKPQYYIIPAFILAHRLITQKRLSVCWDKDSLYLCGFALGYSVVLLTLFSDYLTIILPDVLKLYILIREPWITKVTLGVLSLCAIFILVSKLTVQDLKSFSVLFFLLCMLSMTPYYLQGKGYLNHLAPTLMLFFCGFNLLLYKNFLHILREFKLGTNVSHSAALFLTITLSIIGFYKILVIPNIQLTHDTFKTRPLIKIINECAYEDCDFFIFNDSIEIIHQLATYSNHPHASRFPSYWFLPVVLGANDKQLKAIEKQDMIEKYTAMTAQDFKRLQPKTLFIGKFQINKDEGDFDFIAFFSEHNKDFAQIMHSYTLEETIEINTHDYLIDGGFKDRMAEYDVYRLKNDENMN